MNREEGSGTRLSTHTHTHTAQGGVHTWSREVSSPVESRLLPLFFPFSFESLSAPKSRRSSLSPPHRVIPRPLVPPRRTGVVGGATSARTHWLFPSTFLFLFLFLLLLTLLFWVCSPLFLPQAFVNARRNKAPKEAAKATATHRHPSRSLLSTQQYTHTRTHT